MMSDLMVPSKRPRAPSFSDKNSETHAASVGSDSFPEEEIGQAQVKNFLEVCRFCKKKLSHDKDIFMYGHFGAFCTPQCRAKQMACDIFRVSSEKNAAKAKKGRMCWTKQRPNESKDQSLGNRESNTQPRFYI